MIGYQIQGIGKLSYNGNPKAKLFSPKNNFLNSAFLSFAKISKDFYGKIRIMVLFCTISQKILKRFLGRMFSKNSVFNFSVEGKRTSIIRGENHLIYVLVVIHNCLLYITFWKNRNFLSMNWEKDFCSCTNILVPYKEKISLF